MTPNLSIQDTHLNVHGYATHGGGALDLNVDGNALDIIQSRIGAMGSYPVGLDGGYTLVPEVHVYYLHDFGSDQSTVTAGFAGGGPPFATTGAARDRDVVNVGLGLRLATLGQLTFTGAYDYSAGATSHDHSLFFRLSARF